MGALLFHSRAKASRLGNKIDNAFTLTPGLAERIRQRAKKRLIALRLPEWQISGARRGARPIGLDPPR